MALPRYVTFDCYGTLTDFHLTPATLETLGSRLDGVDTDAFVRRFEVVRYRRPALAVCPVHLGPSLLMAGDVLWPPQVSLVR